ncbi:DsbA family protein [Nakamurella endophytica]|uniref:Thioredoxin-like fold domain-containing protein n=1 Tax=Nakamurella endophytica TaxID=1748367 RepID=A0A917TCM3_9ACTN|nr:thioredoxin domain-containing protein [Nakamurella endophytica]GGM18592.1 hypothetical protein GCM10011594_43320 [Nakamurella endophytica]
MALLRRRSRGLTTETAKTRNGGSKPPTHQDAAEGDDEPAEQQQPAVHLGDAPTQPTTAASKATRESVAARRPVKPSRAPLIVGGLVIAAITTVVVIGLIINAQQGEATSTYGPSTESTATLTADGVITVSSAGHVPRATLDVYVDPLCEACAFFEQQFGQEINDNVDNGALVVRYHMLTFLDGNSASGNYSTRASAALMCIARDVRTRAGGFRSYLESLFATHTQPQDKGSTDLANAQLAQLAVNSGAGSSTASCITSGATTASAKAESTAGQRQLIAAIGRNWSTPTVLQDGKPVNINTRGWLTSLVD